MQSNWQGLADLLSASDTSAAAPPDPRPAQEPGLITSQSARRQAAQQGRLTSAWKQLYSYGLAAPDPGTVRKVQDKWVPPQDNFMLEGRFAQARDIAETLADRHLTKAVRALKPGTAPDSLGWTTETWRALYQNAAVQPIFKELLVQYATGQCGSIAQDLINSSRMIPLYKDAQGSSLRPIAIPTLWQKAFGRATVEQYRPVLRHAAAPSQFAAMTSDGGAKLAATTMAAANNLTGERLLLRTDIQNAFNEIHRHVVYEALSYATPVLAASQYAWLSRPTHAVLDSHTSANIVMSTTGIPQGDPLSSLAFAVALARPIAALQQDHPDDSAVAYADDVLLLAGPERAHIFLNTWQTLIAEMGLKINAFKLVIWSPAGQPIPPRLREACPQAQYTTEGMVICGVPVQAEGGLPEDEAAVLGPPRFSEVFLGQVRRKFARRLAALSALMDAQGPASIATHLAFQVLRVNLQHSFTHLFRVCSWGILAPWAAQLQTDILEWIQTTLHCPLPEGPPRLILALPLRHAGLGILDLQNEAALHFVQGALALSDHGRLSLANMDSWTADVAAAIGYLEARAGINVEDLVAGKPTHKQGRLVWLAFYDSLATRRNTESAWLSPPPGDPATKRLQTQVGSFFSSQWPV